MAGLEACLLICCKWHHNTSFDELPQNLRRACGHAARLHANIRRGGSREHAAQGLASQNSPVVFAKVWLPSWQLATFDNGPKACRQDADGAWRSAVQCIPWGDRDRPLPVAEQYMSLLFYLSTEPLEGMDDICRALLACCETMLWKRPKPSRQSIRSIQQDVRQLEDALQWTNGSPPQTLARQPMRGIQEYLASPESTQTVSFPETVRHISYVTGLTSLKPPLERNFMDTFRLVLQQMVIKTHTAVRIGRATAPRSGLLRPAANGKSKIDISSASSSDDIFATARCKDSAIWIIPRRRVEQMRSHEDSVTVFLQGEVRLIEGLGASQQRLTVSPPVIFPGEPGITEDGEDAEGCIQVLLLVLEDLHQYRYVYDTFLRAMRNLSVSPTFATFVGMRTDAAAVDATAPWLGLAESEARRAVVAEMATLSSLHFSATQKRALMQWHGNVTFLNSPPGGGKTSLMLSIMIFLLRKQPDAKIFVTFRTHALANQFAARLAVLTRQHNLGDVVAQSGYDKENAVEHFNDAISTRAVSHCVAHMRLLGICDTISELLLKLETDSRGVVVRILRLCCEIWEDMQYVLQRQRDVASAKIRLVVATSTFLLKVQAGDVPDLERFFFTADNPPALFF